MTIHTNGVLAVMPNTSGENLQTNSHYHLTSLLHNGTTIDIIGVGCVCG